MKKEYVEVGCMKLLNKFYCGSLLFLFGFSLMIPLIYSFIASRGDTTSIIIIFSLGVFVFIIGGIKIIRAIKKLKEYREW